VIAEPPTVADENARTRLKIEDPFVAATSP